MVTFQWSHEGKVSGLIRVLCRGLRSTPSIKVRLRANDDVIFYGPLDAEDQVPLNVHTHLLANKRTRFLAEAFGSNNNLLATSTTVLDIANIGPLAEAVRGSLRANRVAVVVPGSCDSSLYDYSDETLKPWFDRPDAESAIEEFLRVGAINRTEAELFRQFIEQGFVVLPQTLPVDLLNAASAAIDEAVSTRYQGYEWGSSQRLEQMHVRWPAMQSIWRSPYIHGFLSKLFQAKTAPCQSLVYIFGSQQDAHQDTIHLTPFPAGYMCGVWVALEDVQKDSGELVVYPGSHRLPRVYLSDSGCQKVLGDWSEFGRTVVPRWKQMIETMGVEPVVYRPKRGTVLVWHENLMHGGSLRIDKTLSRKSIVTHNFADGAIAYYDSTGDIGRMYPE